MSLHELRQSTPDSLRAARGFVIGIGIGSCMWSVAIFLYFWLIK